jgi:hypothetical protein
LSFLKEFTQLTQLVRFCGFYHEIICVSIIAKVVQMFVALAAVALALAAPLVAAAFVVAVD